MTLKAIRSGRPLRHLAFWGGTFVFFVLFFGRQAASYVQSFLFVALLLPVAMATTYFLTGFLVPRFLLPGRYGLFALYSVYTMVSSIYLELVVLVTSFVLFAGYDVQSMNPATLDVFGLVVALYVVVFLALAANLTRRWHGLRAAHDEAERARLEAELELRDAEMAVLKAQMQPHFLFNTLNNLYGLTLERSSKAPDVVLRISEMLDYVLYGSDRPLVSLQREIEHLKGYIELERLRYDRRVDIRLRVDGVRETDCVAPLMLIPFVENGFKHGASRSAGAAEIHIEASAADGELYFRVENSVPASSPPSDDVRSQKNGIGLNNVRRRLQLLYPDSHELKVEIGRDRFTVTLRLPIHSCPEIAASEVSS